MGDEAAELLVLRLVTRPFGVEQAVRQPVANESGRLVALLCSPQPTFTRPIICVHPQPTILNEAKTNCASKEVKTNGAFIIPRPACLSLHFDVTFRPLLQDFPFDQLGDVQFGRTFSPPCRHHLSRTSKTSVWIQLLCPICGTSWQDFRFLSREVVPGV